LQKISAAILIIRAVAVTAAVEVEIAAVAAEIADAEKTITIADWVQFVIYRLKILLHSAITQYN
jgi:hypothetical protein